MMLCCLLFLIFINFVHSDYYECNESLFEKAVLNATSSLAGRRPKDAKLHGDSTWTAGLSDNSQYITFDLGHIMKITAIETQGRSASQEYVLEYGISYGYTGYDYGDFKETNGDTKMFKGNVDGDSVKRIHFDTPIIAQWIRINPTRWNIRISMRVDFYGCPYVADNMNFNGNSMLEIGLRESVIASSRDSIKFRMKTNVENGIVLYSKGTQGDYIALQLRDNRLVLNIDLGSGMMTSLSVGSLIDDNRWHDVDISRVSREIVFSVDRVVLAAQIKGENQHLNLDNAIYIGGVPLIQEGMIVSQNFTGCIENLYFNTSNIIQVVKEAYDTGNEWLMQLYKKYNTLYSCVEESVMPVTFLTDDSHVKLLGYEGVKLLNVSLTFRTYEENGLLIYHKFLSNGFVKLHLEKGKLRVALAIVGSPLITIPYYDEIFNDGRWHSIMLVITDNQLLLDVDQRPMEAIRKISITTGSTYNIAGGIPGTPGFVGCMRMIRIDGNYRVPTDWKDEEYCCKTELLFDACQMLDRCNPNPCKHLGVCNQNSKEFYCDCSKTGYGGAVCHTPLNPLSCEAHKHVNPVNQVANINIDVDGSGPLAPFPVTCQFRADGTVVTEIHHKNEERTTVKGFQAEGSYKQDIVYNANAAQIESLMNRASNCWQSIRYFCKQARLFNSPSNEFDFRPFSWWVSRNNEKMDFWGGSVEGTRKCECGIYGNCVDPTKWCNCDSGLVGQFEDGGEIKGKEHLPVRQLRFGDTGTAVDEKEGAYILGPLMCEGDDLFNNAVTFRKSDAGIKLPPFDFGYSGDIYFQFKTTVEEGIIVNAKGPDDEISVELSGGDTIQFTYNAGSGPLTVVRSTTTYRLADDKWHSVSVERNRKGARVVVDGSHKQETSEPPGPMRAFYLTTDLVIGAVASDNKTRQGSKYTGNGFIGCIRAFMLNGRLVDILSYAKRYPYGLSLGCVGKCESNPCLNNGTCIDRYGSYTCDCRWTSFKGPICADEIGVTLRDSSIIKYDFMGDWRSTIAENIRVGFTTTHPQGFLLGLFSNITKEYMTIMISNSGHLRVIFDFGFERQELIYQGKNFGLGQFHDVRIRRKNSGSILVMEVDDYGIQEFNFSVKASADAQFNNIQYLYIGRNESMNEGFSGCISRVEFDDIYPLKFLFQQNPPSNVRSLGSPVVEDFCGVEPVTHPPEPFEERQFVQLDPDKVAAAYHEIDNALVGGILFILFLATILIALFVGRYVARHKGDYVTQEDRGADMALDPDTAVIHSTTGHQVQKKREWFI